LAKTTAWPLDSYFLRAESFYNVATEIDQLGPEILRYYGGVSLHDQSHGESFFALFQHRFRENGLYLMDEPEAALSPKRQLEFLALLHDFVGRGGQFIIATHSPIIMAYPEALIYQLDEKGIREMAYTNTDHYLVTRGFLSNPRRILSELLNDDDPAGRHE
jgi:predicted ATPase